MGCISFSFHCCLSHVSSGSWRARVLAAYCFSHCIFQVYLQVIVTSLGTTQGQNPTNNTENQRENMACKKNLLNSGFFLSSPLPIFNCQVLQSTWYHGQHVKSKHLSTEVCFSGVHSSRESSTHTLSKVSVFIVALSNLIWFVLIRFLNDREECLCVLTCIYEFESTAWSSDIY